VRLRPSRVAGRQALEEPVEGGRVVRVEGRGLPRVDPGRGVLQTVGIAAGQDDIATLSPGAPGRPEPDACAAADHGDALSGPFLCALAGNLKWPRRSWSLR
jgi:hypothetical protein